MIISLRISETDGQLIKAYANYKNQTVSSYLRSLALKDIESEYLKVLEHFLKLPENSMYTE